MTPKKRKIYIAIIIFCFASTGVILFYNLRSPAPANGTLPFVADNGVLATGDASTAPAITSNSKTSYRAPGVFPQNTSFDWSLLNSSEFKNSVPITPLTLNPGDTGRENPFVTY